MARKGDNRRKDPWDAGGVRALRQHMGLSQDALAEELGTRQQTVSEWETGRYRPRGASARMLSVIAERAGFEYDPGGGSETGNRKSEGAAED
jgi:DNA-binding transcriptional regulator YiaG